ncbi:glycosyltransferase [Sphingomonas rosea]|uniref:Glycosyltransferase n=1 Tax=Sphingomonas rosea TaxID=335605 RepID=A0ABP7U9E7_9SPHN
MSSPQVSVLIIVYNRERFVGQAVRSVLGQSFGDFECVVVDDGSTDCTVEVVRAINDPRLKLVVQPRNAGIPVSRNLALDEARGEYIAWLDSDDVCLPDRLAVQRTFLERHPDIDLVGSAARTVTETGRRRPGGRIQPERHEQIRPLLLFRSPFQQSSVFGRADAIKAVPYDPTFPVCEDVDMFARFSEHYRVANLPRFLVERRVHGGQTIRSNVEPIVAMQSRISARFLDAMGVDHSPEDLRRHVLLGGSFNNAICDELLAWAEGWLRRLKEANRASRLFDEAAFAACIDRVYIKAARRLIGADVGSVARFGGRAWRHRSAILPLMKADLLPFAKR